MLDQYDRLRKRNAFLEQYKIIEDITEEFGSARSVEFTICVAHNAECEQGNL
jgi:hypothetical protein